VTETFDTFSGHTASMGGTPQADEAAREDSWPKLLRILAKLAS
jgi:hypothetical protein